jgi:hypothetical protein
VSTFSICCVYFFVNKIVLLVCVCLCVVAFKQWRRVTCSKELAKSRGRGRKNFVNECIYVVLRLPCCTITSHNTAHVYSKSYAIKIAKNIFLSFNRANIVNMNAPLLKTCGSLLETLFSRQTIEKSYKLRISVLFQRKYIEISQQDGKKSRTFCTQ